MGFYHILCGTGTGEKEEKGILIYIGKRKEILDFY
jgi:hypothetical protein